MQVPNEKRISVPEAWNELCRMPIYNIKIYHSKLHSAVHTKWWRANERNRTILIQNNFFRYTFQDEKDQQPENQTLDTLMESYNTHIYSNIGFQYICEIKYKLKIEMFVFWIWYSNS